MAWVVAGHDPATSPESSDAPVEPVVVAVETPVATDPLAEPTAVPVNETPAAAPPALTGPGGTVATQLEDAPPPAPTSVPVITAILLTEGRRLAVVDGRVLGVGQRVGSWELVSVDRDTVVLRDGSGVERVVRLGHE